jgi:hypothetical protein
MRPLLIFLLTIFRDLPVQLGPILGAALGWYGAEYVYSPPLTAALALGYVGWGLGAYWGYHRSNQTSRHHRPKLKVYQGGK